MLWAGSMIEPRIRVVQEGDATFADGALVWLRSVGVQLDEWQEAVLRASLLERDGKWAAMDVGLNVARQNGKGEIIVARILVELYLVGSGLTIYSAHNFDTAMEHFRRLVAIIEASDVLLREVKGTKGSKGVESGYGITWGKGNEAVVLTGNRRFQIRTRTAGGGRGFSSDLLILDEAMFLSEFFNSALRPIISAREKPQIWTTGSAVDQQIHEHGVVFSRVRESAIERNDPDLTYFEWSAGSGAPEDDNPETFGDLDDQAAWAKANPAMGIRITSEVITSERRRMSRRGFAVERLGLGDWPRTDAEGGVIPEEVWAGLEEAGSVLLDPVVLAYDVSPDRQGSISAAGRNAEGRWHIEVVDARRGTDWIPARLAELNVGHRPKKIVCDGGALAGSITPAVQALGLEVYEMSAGEHAAACGQMMDAIDQGDLCHIGQSELTDAVKAAKTRPLGDAWAWSRRNSSANISPLVSCTLALSQAIVTPTQTFAVAAA